MSSFVYDQTGSMEPVAGYRSTRAEFAETGRPVVTSRDLPRKGIDEYSSQIRFKSRESPRVVFSNAGDREPDMLSPCGDFFWVDKRDVRPHAQIVLFGTHERQQAHHQEIQSDAKEHQGIL